MRGYENDSNHNGKCVGKIKIVAYVHDTVAFRLSTNFVRRSLSCVRPLPVNSIVKRHQITARIIPVPG